MDYKTAYNKIIDAYFKDEIKPFDKEFCFCGTLAGGNWHWGWTTFNKDGTKLNYSILEFKDMEMALFSKMKDIAFDGSVVRNINSIELNCTYTEDELFDGMCAALDVLKEIHRSRDENVDEETPSFTKRKLLKETTNSTIANQN